MRWIGAILIIAAIVAWWVLDSVEARHGWIDRVYDRLFGLPNGKDVDSEDQIPGKNEKQGTF
jgi:steroid 5-alpha reductase family enzyme